MTEQLLVPRRTDERIKELARQVMTNQVYFCWAGDNERIVAFEMILAFSQYPTRQWERVGALYAPWSDASPWAINGQPRFFSMGLVHVNDCERLHARMVKIQEAMNA